MSRKLVTMLCTVVALSIVATVFVGCGGNDDGKSSSSVSASVEATKAPVKDVTLRMWEHSPQFEDCVNAVIKAFNVKTPNIKIELEAKAADQYLTLLSTAIQAGDAPDLYQANGNKTSTFPDMVKMGAALDLTGKIDLTGYNKMQLDVVTIDGKLWETPGAALDTRAVYYNKDIFEKNGLTVPNNLADFEKICDTLLSKGITPISFGARDCWTIMFMVEPIFSAVCPDWLDEAAVGKAKVNDPRALAALKKYEQWAQKGYFGKNFLAVDEGAMLLNFSKGNTAMCITGSWNTDVFNKNNPDLKVGAFQIPMAIGGKAMVVTYSAGYAVFGKTKYPDESIKFLQYSVTPEAQQIWISINGGVPALKGLKGKNQLVTEVATADKAVDAMYSIIGYWPKEGQNPRQIFEQDSLKWVGGVLKAEDFLKAMNDAIDYTKVK